MKGRTYKVMQETVNGRSLGIGITLTAFFGLVVYGGVLKLGALLEFTPQTRVATALGLALITILAFSFMINRRFGTHREVNEDVPSSSDLRNVLAAFDTDASSELKNLKGGPVDVLYIAEHAGISEQLAQIALADAASSEAERTI
ncbi:MAG: hypothetical protein HY961_08995 [Ignavibacteriae bacterium]|nr:hypothetical protein [Ignavibacteriota bacterium]